MGAHEEMLQNQYDISLAVVQYKIDTKIERIANNVIHMMHAVDLCAVDVSGYSPPFFHTTQLMRNAKH